MAYLPIIIQTLEPPTVNPLAFSLFLFYFFAATATVVKTEEYRFSIVFSVIPKNVSVSKNYRLLLFNLVFISACPNVNVSENY